jgi:hypothetical protein
MDRDGDGVHTLRHLSVMKWKYRGKTTRRVGWFRRGASVCRVGSVGREFLVQVEVEERSRAGDGVLEAMSGRTVADAGIVAAAVADATAATANP